MDKDNCGTSRLKLVHLLYLLIVAAVMVGAAWGSLSTRQSQNTEEIQKKLNKDIFEQYVQHQQQQFTDLKNTINKGFGRLEDRLNNPEKKIEK